VAATSVVVVVVVALRVRGRWQAHLRTSNMRTRQLQQ